MPTKTIAGFATAAAIIAGGAAADNAINPYTDLPDRLTIQAESSIPDAGMNAVHLVKDRPEVRLKKWNGELDLGVRYDKVQARGQRQLFTDRMEWKGQKEEVYAYPLEAKEGMEDGGFEIEVVLSEMPEGNVFEFQIDGYEALDFFYQPALTPEEIAEGAERPENIVGSFAVYHKEKANYRIGSTNYATGKAFHIYRPKIIAADGAWTWGELEYSEGVLSVTVPQDWLASAQYPVKVDPTFGYTSAGGTISSNPDANINTTNTTRYTASSGDTLTAISVYANDVLGGVITVAVYDWNGTVPVNQFLFDNSTTISGGRKWVTLTGLSSSLTAGTTYVVGVQKNGADNIFYDSTGTGSRAVSFANPWVEGLTFTVNYSVYATYTTSQSGTFTDLYDAEGTYTWTAPTGVTSVMAACWGGGGGGFDGGASGAAGGGGGAFASSTVSVTPGNGYTVVVGAGGAQNSAGADSSFNTTSVVADGGTQGINATTPGTGGTTANSTGDVEYAGGNGAAGDGTDDVGGGGGGAAGPHGAGANALTVTAGTTTGGRGGQGDNGFGGLGGLGVVTTYSASTNDGVANALGGGGGGGGDNGTTAGNGGAPGGGGGGGELTGNARGASGRCEITYTIASGGGGGGGGTTSEIIWFD